MDLLVVEELSVRFALHVARRDAAEQPGDPFPVRNAVAFQGESLSRFRFREERLFDGRTDAEHRESC